MPLSGLPHEGATLLYSQALIALFAFHRVAVHLRGRNAVTRRELGRLIKESYTPSFPVEILHLYNCANMRDLLEPCMFKIPHITKPHAFRIMTDPTDGIIKMQVQERGYEDKWGAINR